MKDLDYVLEEVLDVSAQWYFLGLQLKVRSGELDRIETQFKNPKRCLLEVLKAWLCTDKNPSWKTLMNALRSRTVDTSWLADYLKTKLEETEVNSSTSTSDSQLAVSDIPFAYSSKRKRSSSRASLVVDNLIPAAKYSRKKGEATLLPLVEQYLSKAEVEADPSLPIKYKDYLSLNPAIRAALYTAFNARISAEVFTWSYYTDSSHPITITELLTAFTFKTLVDHSLAHTVQQLRITIFNDLPVDIYKQFHSLCRMAYEGILNRKQQVFSATQLPTGFTPFNLMQEVPQLYNEGRASSYQFIHLTLQEYLAAVYISKLPTQDQIELIQEQLYNDDFKMTMIFLAGLTKVANIPLQIAWKLMKNDDTKLILFHFLFEAEDISVATRTLGSHEMVVDSNYSWTPLDFYVTGHAISHSNCPWTLRFLHSSIDDDKFELFCQGCSTPGKTRCGGHISHVICNDITSKHIQSFVNIPLHILRNMKGLHLSYNELNGSACDLLAKVVSSMTRLELLGLGNNPIGSGGAVQVIKALIGSEAKGLGLPRTEIGVPDCEALCELLKSSHSLQFLYIDDNNLSSQSVGSIITGLSHNNSLTELNISNSHFSIENVANIASVLGDQSKCTWTELILKNCHISSEGAHELASALCNNISLKKLSLSHNPIGGVEGVTALATALVKNKTLTWLELRNCYITGQGASELATALCKNSTLNNLNLNGNPIGVDGAFSMSDMLQHNSSLGYLYLRDDSVGEEGVCKVINSLKRNQTLRNVWLPKEYMPESEISRTEDTYEIIQWM